ncbi:hypothetical protein [uncultured Methanoregula sp.]|uniref:hypothetical protein n=1 Tax=uncultured Methanoregula sp. TaxID=1005933 RepID=UPI002AAA8A83|nr:hypothetical protein [uncultured Methanoregula sp.]
MTRGRKPLMALCEAVLIAGKRGGTQAFMHEPGTICNFVIYCQDFMALVRIKRITRIHCSHAWIECEAADALTMLRAIAPGPGSPASSGSSCPGGHSGSSGPRISG